ncbi:MAG TPA: hypothetical protein VGQ93_09225 [Lysobacter sp.]|nr:hypothetical protein [Lysobacter sp.]
MDASIDVPSSCQSTDNQPQAKFDVDEVQQRHRLGGDAAHCRPMVGGMVTASLLSIFVIPAAYWLMPRQRSAETLTPNSLSLL